MLSAGQEASSGSEGKWVLTERDHGVLRTGWGGKSRPTAGRPRSEQLANFLESTKSLRKEAGRFHHPSCSPLLLSGRRLGDFGTIVHISPLVRSLALSPPSSLLATMESVPLPPILTLPSEVLEFIALELVLLNPVGPPRISAFAQTCKAVRRVLCPDNLSLYGRIFKTTFDTTAPARRYGPHILRSENLKSQLFHNWRALKHIRASDYRTLETDFWTCYLLLLEDDGKNCQQVLWAGVPDLADKFVRTGLHDGSVNWPADSTINSLALWIMWMTLDQGRCGAMLACIHSLTPFIIQHN